jgi:2-iminoacetate synthase ThiH
MSLEAYGAMADSMQSYKSTNQCSFCQFTSHKKSIDTESSEEGNKNAKSYAVMQVCQIFVIK